MDRRRHRDGEDARHLALIVTDREGTQQMQLLGKAELALAGDAVGRALDVEHSRGQQPAGDQRHEDGKKKDLVADIHPGPRQGFPDRPGGKILILR